MKTILRLLCGWMAIALAACTNHDFEQVEALQKPVVQKTISVKAYTPGEQAATRLDFEEGTEGLKLSWTADDAFTAVIGEEKVAFTYDADSKEFTATLPEGVTLTDGIKAYYPAYDDEYTKDLSQQTGALNGATTYMEGKYSNGAFRFTHSTAILKATFSGLPDGAKISSICIVGEGVNIAISNETISREAVYINLPAIVKDTKLKFTVTTTDSEAYTSTKTVTPEEGIRVGVFYNSTVALAKACLLPMGNKIYYALSEFSSSHSSLTKIKFIANSDNTNKDNPIDTSNAYMVAGNDNTLEIHTADAEFVFNEFSNYMFPYLNKITAIDFGDDINTSNVKTMQYMFSNCANLESINFGSNFNTENVTDMYRMFEECSKLTSLDLSGFNTSNVADMQYMFYECKALTSLDLSNFNTSKVTDMELMFYECKALISLDLSSFNTSNVTDMGAMFQLCSSLTSLNLSNFNTANVTYMGNMFNSCSNLESITFGNNFNTSKVTDMSYMFYECSSLTSLDLSNFVFSENTDCDYMFSNLGKNAASKPIPVYVKDEATKTSLEGKGTNINNTNAEIKVKNN
ncbi:MAG: BspA family leucine-rich repeat surface protein [Mediterranea massiliensis]|nr:BspA family leucine-rich repeat surface protein [Mediterranea massiliensis]